MDAYSMYLKKFYRFIFSQIFQEFETLTLFYFRSRVSLPVFCCCCFFFDTYSVKQMMVLLLAADYPLTI